MYNFIKNFSKQQPKKFGTLLAFIGILFLTPDTLIMRLSNLESWPLATWRGLLSGITLLILWRILMKRSYREELSTLYTLPGILVIVAFGTNVITFTLGIQETSVMVVLTALATTPLFAAILSTIFMNESQGVLGWVAILLAMLGVSVVVGDGHSAIGKPEDGSTILGAFYGVITAFGLAFTFTMARKYRKLGIVPAAAIGSLLSGIVGYCLSTTDNLFVAPVWTLMLMGFIILPISFACLTIAPRYTSAAIVSLLMLLEMVIGPFWVWAGIGETPTFLMFGGGALVLLVLVFHICKTQFIMQK